LGNPLILMLLLLCLGVTPRKLKIDGVDHPKVLSYIDVLRHGKKVGKKVAIIGQFLESHKFPNVLSVETEFIGLQALVESALMSRSS
jgi:hypothetical protein